MSSHTAFELDIEGFQGPLALLLDLIERNKLPINDISLATVADEYIRYIESDERVPLKETAHFVVVAATLLLIKSRSLLPTLTLTKDEEADIRDLEHRLHLYAQVRRIARVLRTRWTKRAYTSRHRPKRSAAFTPSPDITPASLTEALTRTLAALPDTQKLTPKPTAHIERVLTLDAVIDSLSKRLQSAYSESFTHITGSVSRVEAIVHFLALLELVKRGSVAAEQPATFHDITITYDTVEDIPRYA